MKLTETLGEHVTANKAGALSVLAYPGDGCVLLAFDLAEDKTADFAGFAVSRKSPDGEHEGLDNRLSFQTAITAETTPAEHKWHPSSTAPFQHFRWVDFPTDPKPGQYTYTVTAMYFKSVESTELEPGDSTSVDVTFNQQAFAKFRFGFSRGYISSQAYTDKFDNKPIRPAGKKTITYSTKPYAAQYAWLGGSARRLLIDALADCQSSDVTVDLFAYDLDEPDFIKTMVLMGKRLRAYLDDAPLHTKPGCAELLAHAALVKSAGKANVQTGHFKRFAHNKVLIFKRKGVPYKVLTGSANFSVRGLYVQANNVLLFDNPDVAQLYEEAFEQAFTAPSEFGHSEIAEGWHAVKGDGMPDAAFAFSPHTSAGISLDRVAGTIQQAKSSVLFAIMELGGSGPVLDDIHQLGQRPEVFRYGITQSKAGLNVYKPSSPNGVVVPFAFLKDKVPAPFRAEISGGIGQVIHDKFVVVDFNGKNPAVFTGSSNLAAGGETSNGDNLLMITDRRVVTAFAVEAIRLVDHYHFRASMQVATDDNPLKLQGSVTKGAWWEPYYDKGNLKCREREVLCGQA
jgi:phosphatidylserine/phosphatidylglycerophosphate/cardiolipin synthase-like enzyme